MAETPTYPENPQHLLLLLLLDTTNSGKQSAVWVSSRVVPEADEPAMNAATLSEVHTAIVRALADGSTVTATVLGSWLQHRTQ